MLEDVLPSLTSIAAFLSSQILRRRMLEVNGFDLKIKSATSRSLL